MFRIPSEYRCSGRHARMVVLAAAAVSVLAMGQARADVTDELLNQLVAKGVLTKGEFVKLKARHEAEKAEMARNGGPMMHRMVTKNGVVIVPDDRYITRLDKGIGFHIPGTISKDGEIGAVDVKISGDLIMFGIENFQSHTTGNVGAGIAGGLAGGSTHNATNGIGVGLLPSAIVLSLATNQMGYDLGFTIGAYVGGNNVAWGVLGANTGGNNIALGTPGIDLRQVFGTIGTPTFGTVKIGRDLGLFGSDAILNDATLLGVGSAPTLPNISNTTLGRIGIGYVYADWIPQVTYTTPDFNGFTASLGAFTPLLTQGIILGEPFSSSILEAEAPMIQGQIKWKGDIAPMAKLTLSSDALWQEHRVDTGDITTLPISSSVSSWGIDAFGKLDIQGFSFVAYGYYGQGLGTTGLFWSGFALDGSPRQSWGGYGQASYTWDKFTFGGSYGISALNANGFDDTAAAEAVYTQFMLKYNQSAIGFIRYQLTPWMALQGEYVHTWATNWSGGQVIQDQIDAGTAWFF